MVIDRMSQFQTLIFDLVLINLGYWMIMQSFLMNFIDFQQQ